MHLNNSAFRISSSLKSASDSKPNGVRSFHLKSCLHPSTKRKHKEKGCLLIMTSILEGVATNAASEASKGIFSFAKRHADYCIHFKKYVEDFQIELEKLEATLIDAQNREKRARDNNEEITNIGKDWLEKAKHLIDVAGELQKKTEDKSNCVIGWCPNCIRRYGLGKKASEMTPTLKKHIADFRSDSFSWPAPRLGMEFYAPKDFVDLDSRKKAYNQLWEALHDDQKLRVGVYAMGGSGKTTLVKKLGYKAEEEKLFEKVVFVVVSNSPDVRRIQENIASQLGLKFENNQESDRARELWSRLTKGEKILIILDDVWEALHFEHIGIPFEDKHKGCKILLTTRKIDVCTSMECPSIELLVLTEQDSWKLFQNYANISDDPSLPLDTAKEIASQCKGLPVAVAIVASMLKDKEPQEWEDVLTNLKDAEPETAIDERPLEIYKCLRLSYTNLKRKEVQELFLLCSFFPEDYEIPMEVLTRYAIGLGIFGDSCSITNARTRAREAIRKLMRSCLLLNVESNEQERVKLHDLIRETAHWIADKSIKEIGRSKSDGDVLDRARYLWFHVINYLPSQLRNCPKLELVMILAELEEAVSDISFEEEEEYFRGLDNLRALILRTEYFSATNQENVTKLLRSVEVLKNLRLLQLNGWELGDISVIGTLNSLECLEMSDCVINELPDKMVELKNLKLLDLSYCSILQNPFQVIVRLKQLEELYYFPMPSYDSPPWVGSENISDFCCKNWQLTKLRRYRIMIGQFAVQLGEQGLINTGLSIDRFDPSSSNATFKNLVGRAEYLHLKDIRGGYKNIVPDVVVAIGGKNQWSKLSLNYCNDIECLFDAANINVSSQDASILSALVELRVSDMDNLRELFHGTPPNSCSFEKLEKLSVQSCNQLHGILFVGNLNLRSLKVVEVNDCPMLTSLFTLSVALSLELLEELYISSCSGLKYIIIADEKDVYDQKMISSAASIFQKLKSLYILYCESLEFIFPVCLAGRLVQLEQIIINQADNLKHISGEYQDEGKKHLYQTYDKEIMLPKLQRIYLAGIPNFNGIFPMYSHPKDYTEVEAISLEAKTPMISQNTDERLILPVSAIQSNCLSKQLLNLCYIREMSLASLPAKIVSLFTLSTAQKMVVNEMLITSCHGLKHIVTNGEEVDFDGKSYVPIFPELQHLNIDSCNQLEFIFPACSVQYPAKLEELLIEDAPELKSVFGQCYHDNHRNENVIHMDSLRELFHGTPPNSGSFEKLKKLSVERCNQLHGMLFVGNVNLRSLKVVRVGSCPMLTSLFTLSVALSLELLEELYISSCSGLKYIIITDEKDVYDQKMISSAASIFQKLKSVRIYYCESLEFIFPVCLAGRLVQLERIAIGDADNLKHIFGEYQDEGKKHLYQTYDKEIMLPKLQEIDLNGIPNFNGIFPMYSHPKDYTEVEAISLEAKTPMISQNTDERLILPVSAIQSNCLSKQLLNLCYIREMSLVSLPAKIVSLFTLSTAQKMVVKYLRIWDCDGLKHIVTNGEEVDFDGMSYVPIFPELQFLSIYNCNQLEFIFPACSAQCPAKLESLLIGNAPELKSVFGQCYHDNHRNENVIHMESRALRLDCRNCPKLATKFMFYSDCITNKAIIRNQELEETPEEEASTGDGDDTSSTVSSPVSANGESAVDDREEIQEEAKIEEDLDSDKSKAIDQNENRDAAPQTSIDFPSELEDIPEEEVSTSSSTVSSPGSANGESGDLDSDKSKAIDQNEHRDAAPQTSIDFPSVEAPEELYSSATSQAIDNNEKIQENSGNPLSSSTISGDAQKEPSSTSATQSNVEEAEEIVQKSSTPAKPAMVASSTESEHRSPSRSTMLGEITAVSNIRMQVRH
ncbi:hypothetical protein L6164_031493 [Bauhinia variegata]|uniref:Uncharacterized protein n=1 Tax=Bauhinia variegata TaxID=167791 RepID=A0ACB9LFS1_BAUVA|nr:hypothetical protein L6164_031493 [Bauhinia variegata]